MELINNAAQLQAHLAVGGSVTVNDQNQLVTQSGWDKFKQGFADIFRSSATIAARNSNVLIAMNNMLRGNAAEGPQNLAAAPLAQGAERANALNDAKLKVINSLLPNAVDKKFPNLEQNHKKALVQHLSEKAKELNPQELSLKLSSLKSSTNSLITAFSRRFPDVQKALAPITSKATAYTPDSPQSQYLSNDVKATSAQYLAQPTKFDENGLFDSAMLDCNRDRPRINGTRVDGHDADERRADFTQKMLEFAPNEAERKTLSILLSQASLSGNVAMLLGLPEIPSFREENPNLQILQNPGSPANDSRFSLSRDEDGNAVLQMKMPIMAQGTLDGVDYTDTPTGGTLSYTLTLPAAQFADGAAPAQPDVQLSNLQVSNEG